MTGIKAELWLKKKQLTKVYYSIICTAILKTKALSNGEDTLTHEPKVQSVS